jgi:excisionase family DNA binding protein
MSRELPESGYTLSEAAKLIGCHRTHIYKMVKRGDLQVFVGLDNRQRVSKEELHHYLRSKGK